MARQGIEQYARSNGRTLVTESMLEEAARQGAQLACLQECFNTWFFAQ